MAEPIAAGVLNTLFQPRISQLGSLTRVARTASQTALKSSTFFTPAPRPGKQSDKTFSAPATIEQHILGCQAWASPPSKQELWGHDGPMRVALMNELTPECIRSGRTKRTSNSNRSRFNQTRGTPLRYYHKSSTRPSQAEGDYVEEHSFCDEPPHNNESYYGEEPSKDLPASDQASVEEEILSIQESNPKKSEFYPPKRRHIFVTIRGNQIVGSDKKLFNQEAFLQWQETGYLEGKHPEELLRMAKFLCDGTDMLHKSGNHALMEQRTQNILYLTELVKKNASTSASVLDQELIDAINARALAFAGKIDEALSFLQRHVEIHGPSLVTSQGEIHTSLFHQVQTTAVLATATHRSRNEALILLYKISILQRQQHEKDSKIVIDQVLSSLLTRVDLVSLKRLQADWDSANREEFLNFLLAALNGLGKLNEAYYFIMGRLDMREFSNPALVVESMLGILSRSRHKKDDRAKMALTLFRTLPTDTPDYLSLHALFDPNVGGKRSFARNVIDAARSEFKKIGFFPERLLTSKDASSLNQTDSVVQPPEALLEEHEPESVNSLELQSQDQYATVVEAFEGQYPKGPDGLRNPHPSVSAYYSVAVALRAKRDHVGTIELWEDMQEQSVFPSIDFLTIILASYRSLYDTRGALSLFTYMKEHGMDGDCMFYTALIRYLTTRMDLKAVEDVYQYALTQGLEPDSQMRMVLLSAYMKCGAWQKGIKMFTEMKATGEKLNIRIYNAILEGCVYMGAPFKTVLRLFARLEMEGVIPNKFTYSILMHHAMIGGNWTFARSLYHDLLSMDLKNSREVEPSKRYVDVALVTIMIRGYLRVKKHPEARAMITEMKRLGLEHTAIIHASIARAYIASGSEDDVQLAEEYITDVVLNQTSWLTNGTKRMRKDPLAMMYAPLLSARTKLKDLEGVERLMGEFLNAGGVPTIGILRHLLNAYGGANQMDNFRVIWDQIMTLAMESHTEVRIDAQSEIKTSMRSITAPLDIYTRYMSQLGQHAELSHTWGRLVDVGADFDEKNWNSYLHACVSAGLIERAFEIVERIIQPNFNYGLRNHFREELDPELPYETKLASIELLRGGPPARPLMTEVQRTRAAWSNRRTNRRTEFIDARGIASDFAYPLRALRKFGPMWHEWAPHTRVLESLLMAVMYLEDGLPLRPIEPGEKMPFDVAALDIEDRSVTEPLLDFLLNKHPRTFHRLRRFRQKERGQLGPRGFREKYIWCRTLK